MWRIRGRLFTLSEHLLCNVKVKGHGKGRGSSLWLILAPGCSKSELCSSRLLEDDINQSFLSFSCSQVKRFKMFSACHQQNIHFQHYWVKGLGVSPRSLQGCCPGCPVGWGSWSHINTRSSISLGVCCCPSWVNILTFYLCATFSLRQEKESLLLFIFSI